MILEIIKISMLFFHVCRRVSYPKILANLRGIQAVHDDEHIGHKHISEINKEEE